MPDTHCLVLGIQNPQRWHVLRIRLSPSSASADVGYQTIPYDVIRREPANYELAMVMRDLLVIHNEVAVFTANVV